MADANTLKTTRATAKAQFTRSEKKLRDSLVTGEEADKVPVTTIKRRFEDVIEKWRRAQDTHDAYIAALGNDTDMALEEAWIDDISKLFDSLEIDVDKHLETIEKATAAALPAPAAASTLNPGGGATLNTVTPKRPLKFEIKLEPFCGDIRKYPEFKETFCKHVESEYKPEKHAFVLRNYLVDSVKEEVSNVGDDYKELWKRLDKKYGDVGKLVDAILFQIKSLPQENAESHSTLNMIKVVEKAYRDLQRLQEESEMHNATTISLIEERLPLNIRHEWVKLVAGENKMTSVEKFTRLLKLLTDWRCRLEYASDSIRLIPEQQGRVFYLNQQPPQPHLQQTIPGLRGSQHPQPQQVIPGATGSQNIKKPGCWHHEAKGGLGDHPIWRCRYFQNCPVNERIQLVIMNKACQVCLLQNCPGVAVPDNCPTGFTCKENGCGMNHNKLLHINQPLPATNPGYQLPPPTTSSGQPAALPIQKF